jgi:RNA polymerase sigma factor (TIGR02999 family)
MPGRDQVTVLRRGMAAGEPEAADRLLAIVYDELRQMARRQRHQAGRSPLGTQSLVHEAFIKLVDQTVQWSSRAQFFAIASKAMRSILIDNARHYLRLKREGGRARVELEEGLLVSEARSEELVALDTALERLQRVDPRLATLVECRFFGGLTIEETADALGTSPATVKRDWIAARTWLYRELHGGPAPAEPVDPPLPS